MPIKYQINVTDNMYEVRLTNLTIIGGCVVVLRSPNSALSGICGQLIVSYKVCDDHRVLHYDLWF